MLNCSQLTYGQMADLVRAIGAEVKKRNPLFVNVYVGGINSAVECLDELHEKKQERPGFDAAK